MSSRAIVRYLQQNKALVLLLLAIGIGVTALTSVAFFVDRVDRALLLQGAALMAADLVIEQSGEVTPQWQERAEQLDLQYSYQVSFPSVIFHNDAPVLVQVKAVDENYPLRGTLKVSAGQDQVDTGPEREQAYGSQTLFGALGLDQQGRQIPLGNLVLTLAGRVNHEPDIGGSLFQFAPRLMINYQDALESGLLTAASRARYRFLLAGPADKIGQYRRWVEARLPPGSRIMSVENARPEMRLALERGRRFLDLAALCASLLAGIAIMLSARQYVNQATDAVAVMRTLGMTGGQALYHHFRELLGTVLLGAALGVGAGYLGQEILYLLVGDWFGEQLPPPGLRSIGLGFSYALILLLFSLPALMRIRQISPLRVLRRDLGSADASTLVSWLVAAGAFSLLVIWQVEDQSLALIMLSMVAGVVLVSIGLGWLLLLLIRPYKGRGGSLGIGVAALTRNTGLTLWQIMGFTMGITMLLLLALVRTDLLETWHDSLPARAPNHFLINVQPAEKADLQRWLESKQIPNSGMYATVRGRLTHIRGKSVDPSDYQEERARRLVSREFSLGFSNTLQTDNEIVSGAPWKPGVFPQGGFSVEVKLAERLGIKPGDSLTFNVAGQPLNAEIVNLRTVSWDSFNVNFFVQGNASLKSGLPTAYITSLYLDENSRAALVRKLASDYPAASLLDVRPMIDRIRQVMDKGAMAVESVFLFTLLAAVLVTLSAVQISRAERAREIAILRSLGASRQLVMSNMLIEFGLIGLISGGLGALLANITGQIIAHRLFDLASGFNMVLWITGLAGGALGMIVVGYFAMRSLLNTSPMHVLQSR